MKTGYTTLIFTSTNCPDGYSLSRYSEALVARGNNSCSTVLYVREATFTLKKGNNSCPIVLYIRQATFTLKKWGVYEVVEED